MADSSPLANSSPPSSPQFDEFRKVFLAKHQQIVENVIRESGRNAMEAIACQTYHLLAEDDVTFALMHGTELKHASKPMLGHNPAPLTIGAREPTRLPSFIVPRAASSNGDSLVFRAPPSSETVLNPLCEAQEVDPAPRKRATFAVKASNSSIDCRSSLGTAKTLQSIVTHDTRKSSVAIQYVGSVPLMDKAQMRKSLRASIQRMSTENLNETLVTMRRTGIFVDGEDMKAKLRLAITAPLYDVAVYYHAEGFFQAVARSVYFENVTLLVIAINALWISIDVDYNNAGIITLAPPVFVVADNFFCIYFLVELMIRFGAFQVKVHCLKDRWFAFDAVLVLLMAWDTWLLPIIFFLAASGSEASDVLGASGFWKVSRTTKVLRMVRLFKIIYHIPELMVVIKALFVATRAVACTVILMLLIIYVFALTFRQISAETPLGSLYFKNVPLTMRLLLVLGTAPDLQEYVDILWRTGGPVHGFIFLIFIMIISITIMNMLVGVLVGVVDTVASIEREQVMVKFVKSNLLALLKVMHEADANDDEKITKAEFRSLIQDHRAIKCFSAMNVDIIGLVDLGDFLFQDEDSLDFATFLDTILQLRGSNQATVKDIVDLRRFITMEFNATLHALELIPHDHDFNFTVSNVFKSAASKPGRDASSPSSSAEPLSPKQNSPPLGNSMPLGEDIREVASENVSNDTTGDEFASKKKSRLKKKHKNGTASTSLLQFPQ